jgi:predicted ArsR family transcriptional regulator
MDWAIRLARLSTQTIIKESADRIADSEYSRVYNKVLLLIKNAGPSGITEGRIIDRLKIEARPRDQALKDLQTVGRIKFERESKVGRGRCKERYVFLR